MAHVTCRLTAKNRDQLRNPTLGNRVWATFTFKRGICLFKTANCVSLTTAYTDRLLLTVMVFVYGPISYHTRFFFDEPNVLLGQFE